MDHLQLANLYVFVYKLLGIEYVLEFIKFSALFVKANERKTQLGIIHHHTFKKKLFSCILFLLAYFSRIQNSHR